MLNCVCSTNTVQCIGIGISISRSTFLCTELWLVLSDAGFHPVPDRYDYATVCFWCSIVCSAVCLFSDADLPVIV